MGSSAILGSWFLVLGSPSMVVGRWSFIVHRSSFIVRMKNRYSTTWFELFLQPIQTVQTEREIAFVARQIPQPAYETVLDLCCGYGRHARLLAERGYRV